MQHREALRPRAYSVTRSSCAGIFKRLLDMSTAAIAAFFVRCACGFDARLLNKPWHDVTILPAEQGACVGKSGVEGSGASLLGMERGSTMTKVSGCPAVWRARGESVTVLHLTARCGTP